MTFRNIVLHDGELMKYKGMNFLINSRGISTVVSVSVEEGEAVQRLEGKGRGNYEEDC